MSHRVIASLSAVAVVVAVVSLGVVPAVAQTEAPRTPWGDPDLQGIWTGSTLTPLERPRDLAEKQFLTERKRLHWNSEPIGIASLSVSLETATPARTIKSGSILEQGSSATGGRH